MARLVPRSPFGRIGCGLLVAVFSCGVVWLANAVQQARMAAQRMDSI
jgi:hypothetical protein